MSNHNQYLASDLPVRFIQRPYSERPYSMLRRRFSRSIVSADSLRYFSSLVMKKPFHHFLIALNMLCLLVLWAAIAIFIHHNVPHGAGFCPSLQKQPNFCTHNFKHCVTSNYLISLYMLQCSTNQHICCSKILVTVMQESYGLSSAMQQMQTKSSTRPELLFCICCEYVLDLPKSVPG